MAAITFGNVAGNWSDDTKWVGGVKPTAADEAIFDATSANCTITAAAVCRGLDCNGYTGTLTNNGFGLTIGDGTAAAGNIAYRTSAGMTVTNAGGISTNITFVSTSATVQTITTNGKNWGNGYWNFNAASGGSWQLTDGLTLGGFGVLTLTKGTLDINGQTCSWGLFNSNNTNTRSLTLGAAAITLTGTNANVLLVDATNLTLSAASSTITCNGVNGNISAGGNWGTIVQNGSNTDQKINTSISCVNYTRTGSANKTDSFTLSGNLTCSGTCTLNGNSSINRLLVKSQTIGTASTITAATVSCSNTDFQDIAFSTAWDASARTDIGDCGGNTNITFPASVAQYYGGVNMNGSYLRENRITSNYCSAPDSVPLSITGDSTYDIKLSADDWTPSALQILLSHWNQTGNKRGFIWYINTDGTLVYTYSVDGSATVSKTSSSATGLTDGSIKWLRVTHDVDNGAGGNDVKFYMSDDGTTWSQLGTTQTTAATVTLFDTDALFEIGTNNVGANGLVGNVYRVRVYSDLAQTNKVFDADFTAQAAGTKSFTESSSNGATVSLTVTGGNWSASAWTTRVPLPQDDVYLGNAFSASQTVTADMPRLGRSIDWTGATGSPTTTIGAIANTMFGNLTMISSMTQSGGTGLTLSGRSSYTLTSNTKQFACPITITAPNGTYTLNDAFNTTGAINLTNGTFNTNNVSVSSLSMSSNNNNTRGLVLGTTTWTITATTAISVWDYRNSNKSLDAASSTFVLNSASNTRTWAIDSISVNPTYGTLNYTVAGSTGELDIIGSNSFAAINFSDASNARSLKFTKATTTTIRNANGFNVKGTAGKLMTLDTIDGAGVFTLTSPSQQGSVDYVSITRSTVDASPKWYAGPLTHSTDGGTNTNWIFTAPPYTETGAQYSVQEIVNNLTGKSGTIQEALCAYYGYTGLPYTEQQIFCIRRGVIPSNRDTVQESLFKNLKSLLGLTGTPTDYSEQDLWNKAFKSGLSITSILGS